jgi:hypothetical protein
MKPITNVVALRGLALNRNSAATTDAVFLSRRSAMEPFSAVMDWTNPNATYERVPKVCGSARMTAHAYRNTNGVIDVEIVPWLPTNCTVKIIRIADSAVHSNLNVAIPSAFHANSCVMAIMIVAITLTNRTTNAKVHNVIRHFDSDALILDFV